MIKQILTHKLTLLVLLGLLLMLPMHSILDLNHERQARRSEAIGRIMASHSGAQRLIGPLLVQPFTLDEPASEKKPAQRRTFYRYLLPQSLEAGITLTATPRQLGIYQTQIYQAEIHLSGHLPLTKEWDVPAGSVAGQPYLAIALSDARGISQVPQVNLAGQPRPVVPGARLGKLAGVHVPLTQPLPAEGPFEVTMTLQGMEWLSLVPLGRDSHLKLTGNWPHPNFLGDFLPASRQVDRTGFRAEWRTSWFASDMENNFERLMRQETHDLPAFTTSLVQPVNHYQLNERSAKYALLFIGLTFLCVLLQELLLARRVHPIQYALVGMGLVIFYLVLLALTEQIGFGPAYLLASLACIALNSLYLGQVLGGRKAALGCAAMLGLLYGVLYALLQVEALALLLGSGLLFAVLALVMYLTRKLDWYALNRPQ